MHISCVSNDLPLTRCQNLVIKSDTPKGRGIFSTALIPSGSIIDICPVLLLGTEENEEHIRKTSLYHYTYNWPVVEKDGKKKTVQAVIFGLGSMFNHSTQEQNVGWIRDMNRLVIIYRALRDIPAGEELCISYGSHLTFEDADRPQLAPPEDELERLHMIEPC